MSNKDKTLPSRPNDPEWLEAIKEHKSNQSEDGQYAESMLLDSMSKVSQSAILPLLEYIKSGDKSQQHDAAKALGYMAKSGALTTQQRYEVKAFLIGVLQSDDLQVGVAFAILEALERIDVDAFWTLVVGWYATNRKGT